MSELDSFDGNLVIVKKDKNDSTFVSVSGFLINIFSNFYILMCQGAGWKELR